MLFFTSGFGFIGLILVLNACGDRREAKKSSYYHVHAALISRARTQAWLAVIFFGAALVCLIEFLK